MSISRLTYGSQKSKNCFLRLYEANNITGRVSPIFSQIEIEKSERNQALQIFNEIYRMANADFRIIGFSIHINNIDISGFVSA